MNKSIAINQSNYIPWKGYFDLIASVDEFILLDDVQYTHSDWRNRNRIKTPEGTKWLTIPIKRKGRISNAICQTEISNNSWAIQHWNTIERCYKSAKYFNEISDILYPLYQKCGNYNLLSEINYIFIQAICKFLDINTVISWSTDYFSLQTLESFNNNQRILALCKTTNTKKYLTGPKAKSYIDINKFDIKNIGITFMDYTNYHTYPQLFNKFEHNVTIIDLLFNNGKKSIDLYRSPKQPENTPKLK